MKKFKSVNRAIKRGHLEVRYDSRPTGQTSAVTGLMEYMQIPYLVRVLSRIKTQSGEIYKRVTFYSHI